MPVLDNPAHGIGTGTRAVTTAGTQVQLSTTPIACRSVAITARPANAGVIWVGGADVDSTAGSQQGVMLSAGGTASFDIDNVAALWIDATVNGEGVGYAYLTN